LALDEFALEVSIQDNETAKKPLIPRVVLRANLIEFIETMIVVGLIGLLTYFHYVNGECANACNGHGKCTSYDMCICNRNWQASDCSERVCMFGLAHVDTPKVKFFS